MAGAIQIRLLPWANVPASVGGDLLCSLARAGLSRNPVPAEAQSGGTAAYGSSIASRLRS
jgi:hypothetical protein